ncbi:MAG: hypothetical protein V1698_00875 [bacterium]
MIIDNEMMFFDKNFTERGRDMQKMKDFFLRIYLFVLSLVSA